LSPLSWQGGRFSLQQRTAGVPPARNGNLPQVRRATPRQSRHLLPGATLSTVSSLSGALGSRCNCPGGPGYVGISEGRRGQPASVLRLLSSLSMATLVGNIRPLAGRSLFSSCTPPRFRLLLPTFLPLSSPRPPSLPVHRERRGRNRADCLLLRHGTGFPLPARGEGARGWGLQAVAAIAMGNSKPLRGGIMGGLVRADGMSGRDPHTYPLFPPHMHEISKNVFKKCMTGARGGGRMRVSILHPSSKGGEGANLQI
jgi:hypothetical protein